MALYIRMYVMCMCGKKIITGGCSLYEPNIQPNIKPNIEPNTCHSRPEGGINENDSSQLRMTWNLP